MREQQFAQDLEFVTPVVEFALVPETSLVVASASLEAERVVVEFAIAPH